MNSSNSTFGRLRHTLSILYDICFPARKITHLGDYTLKNPC